MSPGAGPNQGPPQGGGIFVCVHECLEEVENQCIINLIGEYKNHHSSAVQWGRMNVTSHESALAALKNRASHYPNRDSTRGIDDSIIHLALDETGTVDTSFLCNSNENSEHIALAGQQERNRTTEIGVWEEVLRIHGVASASKPEGVRYIERFKVCHCCCCCRHHHRRINGAPTCDF